MKYSHCKKRKERRAAPISVPLGFLKLVNLAQKSVWHWGWRSFIPSICTRMWEGLRKAPLLPSGGLGGCQLSSMIHNHFKKFLATLYFAGICKESKCTWHGNM